VSNSRHFSFFCSSYLTYLDLETALKNPQKLKVMDVFLKWRSVKDSMERQIYNIGSDKPDSSSD